MIYTKSDLGSLAIKDRHAVDITRGQRSALILFDGLRSARAVLDATAALGVTPADIDALLTRGLLVQTAEPAPVGAPAARTSGAVSARAPAAPEAETPATPRDEGERIRRYRVAYPLATQITATLGLRGFKLNLAVEAAQGFEGLVELLPKLRAAVGDERLRPLRAALDGR